MSFSSPWWLPGGHLQTIVPSLFPPPRVPLRRERWDTPDGDFVDVDFCGDPGAERQLVLFHGLEGGSDSHYARAIAAHAVLHGWRLAMPHFRGCSGEPNRTRRAYHSGDSEEIDWMLRRLGGPLCAMGVSLGGNVLLKWLGEHGEDLPSEVRAAAAVSVPFDLERGSRFIERGFARVYGRHFLRTLRVKARTKLERDPGLFDPTALERARTLFDFDDAVTAPVHGFASASDYYRRSSSLGFLSSIRRPTLLLSAYDDPFLPPAVLREVERVARANRYLSVEFHRRGGHVGFISGRAPWAPRYYAEERVLGFLEAVLSPAGEQSA